MGPHDQALNGMFDDLDGMESKKMFGDDKQDANAGVDITISVVPKSGGEEPLEMHTGGTVPPPKMEADTFSGYDKGKDPLYKKGEVGMSEGGIVEDESTLPPFLRKKKLPLNR